MELIHSYGWEKLDVILQGEQFEVTPASPLLSQAVVLGDRRTFSVYDLTQQVTFGTVRSLNLLIRWKSSEGEWEQAEHAGLNYSSLQERPWRS